MPAHFWAFSDPHTRSGLEVPPYLEVALVRINTILNVSKNYNFLK